MGRPAYEPTDEIRRQILAMRAYGLTTDQISGIIKLNKMTMYKYYRDELENGHAMAIAKVAESLYRKAVEGDTTSAIFYLKTQANWTETTKNEVNVTTDDNATDILISRIERIVERSKDDTPTAH